MGDAYEGGTSPDEHVKVFVQFVEGSGPDAVAVLRHGAERLRVPAEKIAAETRYTVEELPGLYVIAVVRGGELERFIRDQE